MKTVGTVLLLFLLAACGNNELDNQQLFPHTGSQVFEDEVALAENQGALDSGELMYVYATRLRVRSSAEVKEDNIVGVLSYNDKVQPLGEPQENGFVEVNIVETKSQIEPSGHYYLSAKYLSGKQRAVSSSGNGNYFMIQNIATEKLRIYKKVCEGECSHQLVYEADMAVGEDTHDGRTLTIAGNFNITSWHKFYQDGAGLYPSWYDPNYPKLPSPGSSLMSWLSSDLLPYSGASLRGAFGWYAAKVGPDARYQWTHGTFGWGSDKKKFIEATRGIIANIFSDPRSHGCSRTDNESIAYVRHLLPVGSPIIKIYAKEAYSDAQRSSYSSTPKYWNYILTKNGVRVDGQKSDRDQVLAAGTPRSQWLEEGTLTVDAYPDAKGFRGGSWGSTSGENGNVYGLDEGDMRGVFLVDTGMVINYRHPKGVKVGGYKDQLYPPYIVGNPNQPYTLAEPPSNGNDDWDNDGEYDHLFN